MVVVVGENGWPLPLHELLMCFFTVALMEAKRQA